MLAGICFYLTAGCVCVGGGGEEGVLHITSQGMES